MANNCLLYNFKLAFKNIKTLMTEPLFKIKNTVMENYHIGFHIQL